jgi:hypothetical protein
MSKSTKPIDPKTKERYAELIGLELTHPEASGATGISERSGQRLMAKPEYRKIADDYGRSGGRQDAAAQAILDLLTATKPDGSPDHQRRVKGAELYLESVEGGPSRGLPPGVVLRFPVLREARETP